VSNRRAERRRRAPSIREPRQARRDLDRIYLTAQQDEVDFILAYIGSDFQYPHKKEFDTAYMRHLFDYSFQLSKKGYPWLKAVPTESLPMNVQMNAFNSPH
jgi:hypothetical protein